MKIAVYPGSFDPVTNGHLDIIRRTASVFDRVYVSILQNSSKQSLFSVDERKALLLRTTKDIPNVVVDSFSGLLVDYVQSVGANTIVKGLRALSDFEYEFQMALTNKQLCENIETFFLTTSYQYSFLSSSIVKELAQYGGSLDGLVPPEIAEDIYQKTKRK